MKPRVVRPVQALLVVGLLSACLHAQSVGIGTSTPHPSARLHISDNARGLLIPNVELTATNVAAPVTNPATSLLVYNTATAGTGATAVSPGFYYWDGSQWVRLADGGKAWLLTGNAGTNPATNFLGTTDAQPLVIRTNNTEQIRVTANGRVGIGTPTPGAKLEVAGAIKVPEEGTLIFNDPNEAGTPGTDGFRIRYVENFYGGTEDALIIEKTDVNHADPDGGISFVNTGSDGVVEPALTIRGNGRVGIGTTLPAYRLHVAGNVAAHSFINISDQRWKTNIKPIQNALDNVLKMQGVTYYWKVDEYPDKHFPEGEQIGFIAQEIEKVYPQVVLTDKEGHKSVDYSKLTPVLVEAIKEQQKIIEELQKVIQQLQEENSQIKQANAQLSAEIKMLNEKVDNLINSLSNDKKLGYR